MADYTADIQQLYVAYFNRPADVDGLAYWNTQIQAGKATVASVAAAFATQDEYKKAYAGMDNAHVVAQVYLNLFGKTLDKIDTAGFNFWLNALNNKVLTIDNVVTGIAAGAQGADKTALADKVQASTTFTASLDTVAKQVGYKGDAANLQAKQWLSTIIDDASLKAAIDPAALAATITKVTTPVIPPVTINLTVGIDTPVTTAGDDVIIATSADGTKNYLSTFDSVDGGAGVDTIRFVDTATDGTLTTGKFNPVVTGATVANVEKVSVITTGAVNFDSTAWAGVTDVTAVGAGIGDEYIKAASSTNVTLSSATTGMTTVAGGKAVAVTQSAAGAGAVSVTGSGLTSVTVTGGSTATVDNFGTDTAHTTAKGTTLTSVTLNGVTGATASLSGASLTNVTLKNIAQADAVTVNNATASHTLNLTVDAAGKISSTAPVVVTVADAAATTFAVNAAGKSNIAISGAKADVLSVTGAALVQIDATGAAALTKVDASADVGGVTVTGLANTVTSITGGAGNDTITVTTATVADNSKTSVDETVNATVSTGAGNDKVTINGSGDGKFNIDTGAGNDTVAVTARGTGTLNVSMGDGNDTFTSAVAIGATDVIDAGAGSDTLTLALVGSANIGAFSNFDVFDAKALAKSLDVDILASKNTVTEFVASGDVGAGATLLNIGSGVGFRATASMGGALGDTSTVNAITLTQKTAGALTVTVDADESGDATDTADFVNAKVVASNATSVKAVFDSSYLASTTAEKALASDNVTKLDLTASAATTVEVVSGGTGSYNVLNVDAAKATAINVSGAQILDLHVANGAKVLSVDSTAATGGIVVDTAQLGDGAVVKLGSGADLVLATAAAGTSLESVVNFEKTAAVSISTDVADAKASAAAIADADMIGFGMAAAVANNSSVAGGDVAKGVLTFSGAGPSTLTAAIGIADLAAETAGEAVVFQYLGDSYVFVQNGASDIVVKLTGITGVTNFVENGTTDHFFLV